MDEETTIVLEPVLELSTRQQFAKMILATAAGFIAHKLAETAFDKWAARNAGISAYQEITVN